MSEEVWSKRCVRVCFRGAGRMRFCLCFRGAGRVRFCLFCFTGMSEELWSKRCVRVCFRGVRRVRVFSWLFDVVSVFRVR